MSYRQIYLTTVAAPLINLPHRCFVIDVIDARLGGFVLLVSAVAVKLVLSANIYSCPKMHEVVDVIGFVSQRPKFLHQLRFEERLKIVDRPRKAPEAGIVLRDQPRIVK